MMHGSINIKNYKLCAGKYCNICENSLSPEWHDAQSPFQYVAFSNDEEYRYW